ncbi:MAG: hypothetical protein MSA15_15955 [Clostridium sp.]|nr:hypothetical protein [Clostridium sp.]
MLNKSEMNLLNKVMESSIEFKMEAYKMLGEELMKIQQEIATLLGTKEVKYVAPVIPVVPEHKESTEREIQEEKVMNTILGENIKEGQIIKGYCGSCCEPTRQYRKGGELVCLECGEMWELIPYEEYEVTNEFYKAKKEKQPEVKAESHKEIKISKTEAKQPKINHKVSDVKKLINCGPSEGDNAVLFVEKRKDNKHLWYGQIRYNNQIRNFHWSNELPLAIVYGIESFEDLKNANEIIRDAVKEVSPKELIKYDQVLDHADFGGCKARFYYGALEQGAFIYLTPEAHDSDKETDIVAKGYTDSHAFIVRRDGEVFWRHYNYIFSKKPFESTPSKGFDIKLMCEDVDILFEAVCRKYDKAASKEARKAVKVTNDNNNNNSSNNNDPMTADISSLF